MNQGKGKSCVNQAFSKKIFSTASEVWQNYGKQSLDLNFKSTVQLYSLALLPTLLNLAHHYLPISANYSLPKP